MGVRTLDQAKVSLVRDASRRLASAERATLADDVGRIVAIAARLFSAIERQTHLMGEQLVIACGEQARPIVHSMNRHTNVSAREILRSTTEEKSEFSQSG